MTILANYAFELVCMVGTDTSDVGGQDTPWEVSVKPIGISLSEACARLQRNKDLHAYNYEIKDGLIIFHSFETNEIYRALGMALPSRQNEPQQTLADFCKAEGRRLYWLNYKDRQFHLSFYVPELARRIEAQISSPFATTPPPEASS